MLETIGIIITIIVGLIAIWEFFKRKKAGKESVTPVEIETPTVKLEPYYAHSRPIEEYWVGRTDELGKLTEWHEDESVKIMSLVAFGGVGKSALARKWLEGKEADGVFWWCFYKEPTLDMFLETALNYFSEGQFIPDDAKSSYAKVRLLLDYMEKGRFILVLDGLEDMQKDDTKSEHFGEMKEAAFTDLLQLWAKGDHNSLLLITTRFPLKDLELYEGKSYRSLSLKHLPPEDARGLMRRRGVDKGEDEELDRVAKAYNYHALSIRLISSYLVEYCDGKIQAAPSIPDSIVMDDEKIVKRILEYYAEKLDEVEKAFLSIFSIFRHQVEEDAFNKVFCKEIASFNDSDDLEFKQMLRHLINLGLINEDEHKSQVSYSTHPLIRKYYNEHLDEKTRINLHQIVAKYYLDKAHDKPKTLDDLTCATEAFQHTIWAKNYEEADRIYDERINIRDTVGNYLLGHNLGAFGLDLSLVSQLFPDGDTSQEPLVASADEKAWLINMVGMCIMNLGRLAEAVPFIQRNLKMRMAQKSWTNVSLVSQNLCEIQLKLGNLAEGETAARQALEWAQQGENKISERNSLAFLAYATFLQVKHKEAEGLFEQANELESKIDPRKKWPYSNRGIYYAEFLARTEKNELAEEVTKENLIFCKQFHVINDIARCYRLLAVLALDRKDYTQAKDHLDSGLQTARNIGLQEEIAKLYLNYARLHLAQKDLPQANIALTETLSICTRCGYKIIEIDAHNIHAQILHAEGKSTDARKKAQTAYDMSKECGYHWGKIDAQKNLDAD